MRPAIGPCRLRPPVKRAHPFRDAAAAGLTRLVAFALQPLPHRTQLALAGTLGSAILTLAPGLARRADRNLALIFPDMPVDARQRIRRGMARQIAWTLTEIMLMPQLLNRAGSLHVSGPGLAAIKAAIQGGRGALVVSGHLGQWEAVRATLKAEGVECGAIYRAFENRAFDRAFKPRIAMAGEPIFAKGRPGTRGMVRHLARGGCVAILTDQRSGGTWFDFIGQPARTATAAAELALKFGLPLVPSYGIRRGDDPAAVDVVFESPIPHSDPKTMTQALNDSLAARVRANPEQYLWLHWRWGNPNRKPQPPESDRTGPAER